MTECIWGGNVTLVEPPPPSHMCIPCIIFFSVFASILPRFMVYEGNIIAQCRSMICFWDKSALLRILIIKFVTHGFILCWSWRGTRARHMSSSSHWLKLCRILHRTCVSRFIRRFFYVGDSPYLMSKKIVFNEICCLVQIYILYTHINFCYFIKKIKHTHTLQMLYTYTKMA